MPNILIVEDDPVLGQQLKEILSNNSFTVTIARDGKAGLELALSKPYDIIVLDRMLPKLSGLSMLKELRAEKIAVPVLLLSALGSVDERVQGLRAGGDDYMVKPFAASELTARIQALLRRRSSGGEQRSSMQMESLQIGPLSINLIARSVVREEQQIRFSAKEFELLNYFIQNLDAVITRRMLIENVWGYHFDPGTNLVEVHVSRLRRKIDEGFKGNMLVTVRGKGYMFRSKIMDSKEPDDGSSDT